MLLGTWRFMTFGLLKTADIMHSPRHSYFIIHPGFAQWALYIYMEWDLQVTEWSQIWRPWRPWATSVSVPLRGLSCLRVSADWNRHNSGPPLPPYLTSLIYISFKILISTLHSLLVLEIFWVMWYSNEISWKIVCISRGSVQVQAFV